jgi:rhamnosyltransferase
MNKGLVSIIIRTKNEERWIKVCLDSIYSQIYENFEIIIVDNESTDSTLNIVSEYKDIKVISIKNFLPGKAINSGINSSSGDYIVCISAHCIPVDNEWLLKLVGSLVSLPNCAGVYGRQIPVGFTPNMDKRDLLTVFGIEQRIQTKDYFFHNANSIIRRDVWGKFPFSDKATNIEDRLWGKKIIEANYIIKYDPIPAVYHYHGLNQSNKSNRRLNGIVKILEDNLANDEFSKTSSMPDGISAGHASVFLFMSIKKKELAGKSNVTLFKEKAKFILDSSLNIKGFVYASHIDLNIENSIWIDKNKIDMADSLSLPELMFRSKNELVCKKSFPYALIYYNWNYKKTELRVIDDIIKVALDKGVDICFMALKEFSHIWKYDKNNEGYSIVENNEILLDRESRNPNLRAIYGQGLFVLSSWLKHFQDNFFKGGCEVVITEKTDFLKRSK